MIKTFKHKGLEQFFETGTKAGIQPHHASKLSHQLLRLDLAKSHEDMNVPDWKLHNLVVNLLGIFRLL
jgi:proteic killer suppression protein